MIRRLLRGARNASTAAMWGIRRPPRSGSNRSGAPVEYGAVQPPTEERKMSPIALFGALLIAGLAGALVRGAGPEKGVASSHREAPVISEDPVADNTDVYAFVSPDKPRTVTLIANYIPFQNPQGGPN